MERAEVTTLSKMFLTSSAETACVVLVPSRRWRAALRTSLMPASGPRDERGAQSSDENTSSPMKIMSWSILGGSFCEL